MARNRKIEAGTALQAALASFWRHGYGALGTRQLEAETGITRFTLQNVYGGKKPLFLLALDGYLDQMESDLIPSMNDGTVEGLARWFENRSSGQGLPEQARHGCMMIAAINEFSATDADVTEREERFQAMLRNGFRQTLTALRTNGVLAPALDLDAAVELLLAATIGLNVVVRGAGPSAAAHEVAQGIGRIVRSWQV